MTKMLIIPDAHAYPGLDNDRFDVLGRFIALEQPDVLVCLGDLADMPSLSAYDKGTKGFEGRRYKHDIEAANDALARIEAGIDLVNVGRAANHRVRYRPEKHVTIGNHENRIDRAANSSPELAGTLSLDDIHFAQYDWTVHPYKEVVNIHGFAVSHHFFNDTGREMGGENLAKALLAKESESCIVGHSHRLDSAVRTTGLGRKLLGLVAGCYVHPQYGEQGWAKGGSRRWWSGVTVLGGVYNGWADEVRFVSALQMEGLVSDGRHV